MPAGGPRLVLVGAAGFTNLGDDAILAAMLAELRAALPGAHFAVAVGDPAWSAATDVLDGDDVTPLPFDDATLARAIRGADLLVVGGGGFIYDYDARISAHAFLHGDSSKFYPHYRAILTAHSCGVPIYLYAVGIGPLLTAAGRGLTRTLLSLASAITVRDPLSLVELRAAGHRTPAPVLTADPAVRLAPAAPRRRPGRRLGIVARAWLRLGAGWTANGRVAYAHYLDWLAAGADHAVERWEAEPVFLPLQRRYDDDAVVADQVIARMRHGARARVCGDLSDYRALQATIADLGAIVSTRLHPLILAGVAGVPPIGVTASPKIGAFLRSLGLGECAVSPWVGRASDLTMALDRAFGAPEAIRERLQAGMAAQAAAASHNPAIAAAQVGAAAPAGVGR